MNSERYDGQTYYEILEIQPTAGPGDIYAAYQRARATYSPSSPALYSMFSVEEAQQLMALIEEAYQTLSHQARRREYDTRLTGQPSSPPGAASIRRAMEEQWVGPVKVAPRPPAAPAGFARTKFSTYEIRPEIEQELAEATHIDGAYLQKARLYKGVTLEQMSEEIRVVKATLAALEANVLQSLPVAVFTRGFVVQYARALGLSERVVADGYMKYFKAERK